MKRIMNGNGSGEWSISSDKYFEAFARLAAIEDILGDEYDLDRLRVIMDAEQHGDLETIMAYNSDTCQFCKNGQCYVRGGTKSCLPKWRGQKEE